MSWTAVAPVPMTATRRPSSGYSSSQAVVWMTLPAKSVTPGMSGTFGWERKPVAVIRYRADSDDGAREEPMDSDERSREEPMDSDERSREEPMDSDERSREEPMDVSASATVTRQTFASSSHLAPSTMVLNPLLLRTSS